jgi:hypothetical protein
MNSLHVHDNLNMTKLELTLKKFRVSFILNTTYCSWKEKQNKTENSSTLGFRSGLDVRIYLFPIMSPLLFYFHNFNADLNTCSYKAAK